jgi:uncharacterized protein
MNLNRRSIFFAMVAAGAAVNMPLASGQSKGPLASPKTLRWNELVPATWDPSTFFKQRSRGVIVDGSAEEIELTRQLREVWDNAPTRPELEGMAIRLPGFVVPLDQTASGLTELLLVPYFGACIHSPPPPANQIVHVILDKPSKLSSMDMIWAIGTLRTKRANSPMGTSGYQMEKARTEPLKEDMPTLLKLLAK